MRAGKRIWALAVGWLVVVAAHRSGSACADEPKLTEEVLASYASARPKVVGAKSPEEKARTLADAHVDAAQASEIEAILAELSKSDEREFERGLATAEDEFKAKAKQVLADPRLPPLMAVYISVTVRLNLFETMGATTRDESDRVDALGKRFRAYMKAIGEGREPDARLDDLLREGLELERPMADRRGDRARVAEIDAGLASLKQGRWPADIARLLETVKDGIPPPGAPLPTPPKSGATAPVGVAPPSAARAHNTGLVRAWRARLVGDAGASGLEPWQKVLRSPDPARRLHTLRWLGQQVGFGFAGASTTSLDPDRVVAEIVAVVVAALAGPSWPSRRGEDSDEGEEKDDVRRASLDVLGLLGRSTVVSMAPWLESPDPRRRAFAAEALHGVTVGMPLDVAAPLATWAKSARRAEFDPRLAQDWVRRLARTREALAAALPRIRVALSDADPWVRWDLLETLATFSYSDEATIDAVLRSASSAQGQERAHALAALGGARSPTERVRTRLLEGLERETDADARAAAGKGLVGQGDAAFSLLEPRYAGLAFPARRSLLVALAETADERHDPNVKASAPLAALLRRALATPSGPEVQGLALRAAAAWGVHDDVRVGELVDRALGGDMFASTQAFKDLEALGPAAAPAVPHLVRWLESPAATAELDNPVALTLGGVLDVLEAVGPAALSAIPALERLDARGGAMAMMIRPKLRQTIRKIRHPEEEDDEDAETSGFETGR